MEILNLCLVCAALFGGCLSLPPPMDFLCRMLNVTLTQLEEIADNFRFRTEDSIANDVKFYHYTSPTKFEEIRKFEGPKNIPTKIIVHGWGSSAVESDASVTKMAQNYQKRSIPHNVLVVDWSKHSKSFDYAYAARLTMAVGKLIGDFVLDNFDSLAHVHLIGHSLGAHVMGFAGKRVKGRGAEGGGKIGRITGLDPAAPLFEYPVKLPEELRLSRGDAAFVDVIHTNAGFFGVRDRHGSADFYVEGGGPIQPECLKAPPDVVEIAACSHYKSVEYFEESISGRKFRAVSCPGLSPLETLACDGNSTASMGEDVEKTSTGIYQLYR